MKKILILICIVTLSNVIPSGVEEGVCFSQETSRQFIHKGILRAQGTISPGMMLKKNVSTISLHGNLEYYAADNISFRGDIFYSLKANELLEFNHSVFSGVSYHFKTKNNFDPYLSFQPGISYANYFHITNYISKAQVSPLASSVLGFNFYFQRWFHLFAETRYTYGKHISESRVISLSELRFSFGLGFNLNVIKPKI